MNVNDTYIIVWFVPVVIGILLGIWHEEKIIAWEDRVWQRIKRTLFQNGKEAKHEST